MKDGSTFHRLLRWVDPLLEDSERNIFASHYAGRDREPGVRAAGDVGGLVYGQREAFAASVLLALIAHRPLALISDCLVIEALLVYVTGRKGGFDLYIRRFHVGDPDA